MSDRSETTGWQPIETLRRRRTEQKWISGSPMRAIHQIAQTDELVERIFRECNLAGDLTRAKLALGNAIDAAREQGREASAARSQANAGDGAMTERQTDKEWLLSDLRERLDSAYLRLPRKTGLMRQVTEEGISRFRRLIAMVQEIAE